MVLARRAREQGASTWQVILGILGVLLVLVVLVVLAAGVIVSRFVKIEVQRDGEGERVAVRTPIGEVTVQKGEEAAKRLRLPVYPDAEPEDEGVAIRLWGRLEQEEGGLDVTAAEFRTPESLERVDEWYREQLSAEFTREKGRIVGEGEAGDEGHGWEIRVEPDGDDIIYKNEADKRVRGVVLKREHGWTKIGLFEVGEARHQ